MPSHRSTAEVVCDAAAERPRPAPMLCPCENGGICKKTDDNTNELECACAEDFHGQFCEIHVARNSQPNGANTAAIVVPIVVVLLVLVSAAGVFMYLRKRPL